MLFESIIAEDLMTKNPTRVSLDDRLYLVKEIFDTHDFRHLLVEDEGVLVGILSDRDLFRNISPNVHTEKYTFNDVDTLATPVHRIVTRQVISVKKDTSLKQIINIFTHNRISAMPVIDDDNKILGIISWKDVLNKIASII